MDHSTVTPFSTTGYLVSPPEVADENMDDFFADIKELSAKNLALCKRLPRQQANRIRESIRYMRSMGFSSDSINRTVEKSIRKINSEVLQLHEDVASFDSSKKEVTNGLHATSDKICVLNCEFQPILPPKSDIKDYIDEGAISSYMNRMAMARLMDARKVQARPKSNPSSNFPPESSGNDFPGVTSVVKTVGKQYLKNKIDERFGKGPAEVADKLEKFFSLQAPENSENPWRYKAISLGVQCGIKEGLAYFLPGGFPVFATMNVSHIVAESVESLTPVLKKMETGMDAKRWWIYQYDFGSEDFSSLGSVKIATGCDSIGKNP